MAKVVSTALVDAAGLAARLEPRDDVVRERRAGDRRFEATDGPFRAYERRVDVEPADGDRRFAVTETVDFTLAIPFWWFVFILPYKRALGRRPRTGGQPWWAPPQRLDATSAHTLALLCSISVVGGYLGSLITQTITFAAEEFGSSDAAQGNTLAVLRAGVPIALVLVSLADRRGRRVMLVGTAAAGCVIAVTGAFAPNLVALGLSQTIARAFSTALGLLILIVAAEEMPAGSRAYAVSILAMTSALGSGVVLWALPLADVGERGWRVLYVIPLLGLPVVFAAGRLLPESRRFRAPHPEAGLAGHGARLWLLAAAAFLGALFVAPAAQLMNEFLRDERGFSAARISIFTAATNTPAVLGIVVGGRLADVRGRRIVGSVGWAVGTIFTVAMFLAAGWQMWGWSVVGAIVGAATIPALGVYGPELFPTSLRGRANGIVTVFLVAGSATGLVAAGQLSDHLGGLGPAMTILAAGPLVLAVLILVAFPETARRELEDLNPEDRTVTEASPASP